MYESRRVVTVRTERKFRRYADWVEPKCELYATLSRATAEDRRLLEIAREARPEQPEPELLLAAVHSLLLDGKEHRLRAFYPSCAGTPPEDSPVSSFRDFCLTYETELRRIIRTRRCQTNDVGRSAVLRPAFEHVANTTGAETVAQLEIGTSAGLNLNWDRYQYDFAGVGSFGDTDSPVTIQTTVRGETRPPLSQSVPTVKHRCGVDLNVLDVTDEADARWLHALVHPNQHRRHERLAGAIEIGREHRHQLIEGDVIEELPRMLSTAPDDIPLIVFSTHVLYQLPEETIAELRAIISCHSSTQPVHWLSIDPEEALSDPTYRWVQFDDGVVKETQLATFESYGTWLNWSGARGVQN
ncbi:DUF2332 domain-containing protein [Halobaculum limi]|uniref:DUF2332 domain-containing protein n=1 Tax=Halobaculum limi TaxID=3031916 RepID=UPI002405C37C|nr:DUF2332 domain-containing protein [Halobaculum sp. YSMS11]